MATKSADGEVNGKNEAWVELQLHQSMKESEPVIETQHESTCSGSLEKLLIDAQRESCSASHTNSKESSARGSPGSPHSPSVDWSAGEWGPKQDPGTDWIWDWSSGPEIQPTSDWNQKFRHPSSKYHRIPVSIAKSPVAKSRTFHFDNLPTLLLTHACTFVFGAALMFVYLKKYCNWNGIPSSHD